MNLGGIILCGGESRRMGYPKAQLPFGPETLLQRAVRIIAEVADSLVVVAAESQELPELPGGVILVRDKNPQLGPLEGLRVGLSALPEDIEFAYASSCDVPFLTADFVKRMASFLGDRKIVVPEADGFRHPLAGIYHKTVLPEIEHLLANDRRRPVYLFDLVPTRVVQPEELRTIDPELRSLRNLNSPESYFAALHESGFEAPIEVREALAATPNSN